MRARRDAAAGGHSRSLSSEQFKGWVTRSTDTVVNDPALQGTQGFGTPTVLVNGEKLANLTDVITKIDAAAK